MDNLDRTNVVQVCICRRASDPCFVILLFRFMQSLLARRAALVCAPEPASAEAIRAAVLTSPYPEFEYAFKNRE